MKTYLEFHDEKSSKFWEVTVEEATMTTRWGKVGSSGQSAVKQFETQSAAEAEANKKILEKSKKGYQVCGVREEQDESSSAGISTPVSEIQGDVLYRENPKNNSKFDFYYASLNGSNVTTRWGAAGGKVKSKSKDYESTDKAAKALNRAIKKQVEGGYFYCAGDENGPDLKAPMSLSEAPIDFDARLGMLADLGIFIHADHHYSFHDDHCDPLAVLRVHGCEHPDNPILDFKEAIRGSKEIIEHLEWYRDTAIRSSTQEEWLNELDDKTTGAYCTWHRLDSADPNMGAFLINGHAEAVELCVATKLLVGNVSDYKASHTRSHTRLENDRSGLSDIAYEIEDLIEDGGEPTELGRTCLTQCARLIAEIRHWLFAGCDVVSYDLTTDLTYMGLQRPFALRAYLVRNIETNVMWAYVYHMQFEF